MKSALRHFTTVANDHDMFAGIVSDLHPEAAWEDDQLLSVVCVNRALEWDKATQSVLGDAVNAWIAGSFLK